MSACNAQTKQKRQEKETDFEWLAITRQAANWHHLLHSVLVRSKHGWSALACRRQAKPATCNRWRQSTSLAGA